MSNFDLIDDYLTNRLGEREKGDFEQLMGSDPGLRVDVDAQRIVVDSIKKARVAELKTMLNNVPVGGLSTGISAVKIAAVIVSVGVVGMALYFYFQSPETIESKPSKSSSEQPAPTTAPIVTAIDSASHKNSQPVAATPVASAVKKEGKKSTKQKTATKSALPQQQPKIEVVDPSDELVDNKSSSVDGSGGQKAGVTLSHIAVETNDASKKYHFHYQFKEGKLVLYGTFDKSLYEILEIHGDSHAVFLYYKENYYLLSEKQSRITPLTPINDAMLLKKLKEYRGR